MKLIWFEKKFNSFSKLEEAKNNRYVFRLFYSQGSRVILILTLDI